MDETTRALLAATPWIAAVIAAVVILIFAVLWYRRSAVESSRVRPFSADPATFAEYSYGRIREGYLDALKQASVTQGLGIALGIIAVVFGAAALLMWYGAQPEELVLAFLVASIAAAVLAIVAFINATTNRRLLNTLVDTIRTDWKLREAVRLAETVGDPQVRTRLITALAFHLSGSVPTPGMLREMIVQRERAAAAPEPAPTFFQWREHFRRCGRKHGRRLVLERDYL